MSSPSSVPPTQEQPSIPVSMPPGQIDPLYSISIPRAEANLGQPFPMQPDIGDGSIMFPMQPDIGDGSIMFPPSSALTQSTNQNHVQPPYATNTQHQMVPTPFPTPPAYPQYIPRSTVPMLVRCLLIPGNGSPIRQMWVELVMNSKGTFFPTSVMSVVCFEDPTRKVIVRTPRTFCFSLLREDQAKQSLSPRFPRYMPNLIIHLYVATTSSSAASTPRTSRTTSTCHIASAGMYSFLSSTINSANLKIPARGSALQFLRMCQALCCIPIYWWK